MDHEAVFATAHKIYPSSGVTRERWLKPCGAFSRPRRAQEALADRAGLSLRAVSDLERRVWHASHTSTVGLWWTRSHVCQIRDDSEAVLDAQSQLGWSGRRAVSNAAEFLQTVAIRRNISALHPERPCHLANVNIPP